MSVTVGCLYVWHTFHLIGNDNGDVLPFCKETVLKWGNVLANCGLLYEYFITIRC